MKRLDTNEHLLAQLAQESRRATLLELIDKQLDGLERLLETNVAQVQDAGAYNIAAGYVEQLRFWSAAAFFSPENNLDKLKDGISTASMIDHPLNKGNS